MAGYNFRQFTYETGSAPFAQEQEIVLFRHFYGEPLTNQQKARPDPYLMDAGASVLIEDWLNSDWLLDDLGEEAVDLLKQQDNIPLVNKFKKDLVRGYYFPNKNADLFVAENLNSAMRKKVVGVGRFAMEGYRQGSPKPNTVIIKHKTNYAVTKEVAVSPEYDNKDLRLAIMYAGLNYFKFTRPELFPTAEVSSNDSHYLKMLDGLGYKALKSEFIPILGEGTEVEWITLKAKKPVPEVCDIMAEKDPWLDQAIAA